MAKYWYLTDMGLIDNDNTEYNKLKKAYGTLFVEEDGNSIKLKYISIDDNGNPIEKQIYPSQN